MMQVVNTYSFNDGLNFIEKNHPGELKEVLKAIASVNVVDCFCKESAELTKQLKLLCSPTAMNDCLKLMLHEKGWTEKAYDKKKVYKEPRLNFGKGRFREMDGIKNKVGLEIQFGKYAFMGYDIFTKMVIFNKRGSIDCGIEVVAGQELIKDMSTGVSSFEQLMIDFEHRGVSNIDIPVYVIGIGYTDEERKKAKELQALFKSDKEGTLKMITLRKYNGSLPGPKKLPGL
jgi:hypothetical protein